MFGISAARVEFRIVSSAPVVAVYDNLVNTALMTFRKHLTFASSTPSPYGGSVKIKFIAPAISPLG